MIVRRPIRNIIFDLGVVIINVDTQRTIEAFRKLGIEDIDEIYSSDVFTDLFDDFETGSIAPKKFRNELRNYIPKKVSNQVIYNAWNAMLMDIPVKTIDLLKKLKSEYRIFLLSNTNEIHMKEIHRYVSENYDVSSLDDLFHKTYYSYIEHLRKPDKDLFIRVFSENHLNPLETLFIDDTKEYTNVAEKLGITCHHYKEKDTLKKVLRKHKIITRIAN